MNPNPDSEMALNVKREQIGVVLQHYPFGLILGNIGGWLTAVGFPSTWHFTLTCNGVYLVYTLMTIRLVKKHWLPASANRDIDALSLKISVSQLGAGVILGVYAFWLIRFGSYEQLTIALLYASVLASMSVPYAATHLASLFAYSFPVMIGVQLACLIRMDDLKLLTFVAVSMPFFSGTLTYYGYTHNRSTRNHILVRLEKEQLSQHLANEVERIQKARQAAENAERAKTRFLAAASHDLRQPLQALHLFLDALDRKDLNQPQHYALHHIDLALASLSQMLDALLDFSRIESGAVAFQPENLALQPLLHNLLKLMGPLADKRGLVMRLRDTKAIAHTDRMLLEMVLRNFISNALRYTHQGGVLLSARRRGQKVMVEVWDTGIGISPKNLAVIFNEFFQLGNPERDWEKGLGLGLAIVQGISRLIGGDIEVKSRLGRGSVFRLWLPLADTTPHPASLIFTTGQYIDITGLQILVVDDNSTVANGMGSLLSPKGCVCFFASDLQSAQLLIQSNHMDVVITDYRLRDHETGGQVIESLRRIQPCLPAIIITGDTDPALRDEAQRLNAHILTKPVPAASLILAIQTQMLRATTLPVVNSALQPDHFG